MAASSTQEDDGLVQGINVTPLVDVCLVLLVIMMVTAKAIVSQQVPLDLPKAAMSTEAQIVFKVEITPDGSVSVDGEKLEKIEDLLARARAAHNDNPQLRVSIRADAAVSHGRVMRVVDLLKQAGVSKIAFASIEIPKEPGAVQN
jgi:biopolymer transport protein ExbD